DADIELDDTLLFRIVGHRVGADGRPGCLGHEIEQAEFFPVAPILLTDIEILVMHFVRRHFQLHIAAGTKIHTVPLGNGQHQFLDEGGHVVVGNNRAFPLLDPEELRCDLDLHVLLDGHLTGQAPVRLCLSEGEVTLFGRQHGAAALDDLTATLCAGATATTGRGQVDTSVGQGVQQLAARGHLDGLGGISVDLDTHVAGAHQPGPRCQNQHDEDHDNDGEHHHTADNCSYIDHLQNP